MKKITFLLVLLSVNFCNSQELLKDGGFENANTENVWYNADGPAALGFPFANDTQRTGDYRANLGNEKGSINQDITPTPGVEYTVSFWWRFNNTGSTTDATAGIYTTASGTTVSDEIRLPMGTESGEDWQNTTFTFTSTFPSVRFTVSKPYRSIVTPQSVNNSMRFDDMSIVPTSSLSVDNFSKFNFRTYPNPADDNLYLSAANTIEKIEIYNLLGKQVINQQISNKTYKTNISDLSQGVYLLKVYIDGVVGTRKFVKR
ncbi:T9SS type A sorting domain-containing protein [Polaribacter sp. M15]